MSARRARSRPQLFPLLAALCAAAVCCQRVDDPAPRQPIVDLVATFPFTERRPATSRIDFGDRAAQLLLGEGWTAPETLEDGSVVRRNAAPLTWLSFDAGHVPGPLRVVVRARADLPRTLHPRLQERVSQVRVRLNDEYLTTVRLAPESRTVAFEVPPERLRPGRNEIALRHGGFVPPRARVRHPGVQFLYESIVFEPLAPRPSGPRLASGGARLVLPPGAAAPFFFRVPGAAELRFSVEPADAAPALRLTLQDDGGPLRSVTAHGESEQRARLDLPEGTIAGLVAEVPSDGPEVTLVGPAVWGRPAAARPAGEPGPPAWAGANVLLYVIDTLRADRLGCYGKSDGLSPAIDGLARDGILFEELVAQASWTRPATASILTGEYPVRHGAITLENSIAPGVTSLAERLQGAGYRTGGFVTNVNVGDQFGFGRGFEVYHYLPEVTSRPGIHTPAAELHAEFLRWLDDHPGERFFGYLHATDPHGPYTPDPETSRRLGRATDAGVTNQHIRDGQPPRSSMRATAAETTYLRGLYEAEIADLDATIATLVSELGRRSLLERTIVVLVADHGEEFADHGGFGHGRTLYREQLHVPLIVRLPGRAQAGTRVKRLARQIDVLPTILSLLGTTPPPGPGAPLLDAAGRPTPGGDDESLAETRLAGEGATALIADPWKAILSQRSGRIELYDWRRDPTEQHDQAGAHAVRVGYARQRLLELGGQAIGEPPTPTPAPPLDAETRDRLEALGYLH